MAGIQMEAQGTDQLLSIHSTFAYVAEQRPRAASHTPDGYLLTAATARTNFITV